MPAIRPIIKLPAIFISNVETGKFLLGKKEAAYLSIDPMLPPNPTKIKFFNIVN